MMKIFFVLIACFFVTDIFAKGISGPRTICAGSTHQYKYGGKRSGTWQCSSGKIDSVTGLLTADIMGHDVIIVRYMHKTKQIATYSVTVNSVPQLTMPHICPGASFPLTLAPTFAGGSWSSKDTSIASVKNGIVTAMKGGATTIMYATAVQCIATVSATVANVVALPNRLFVHSQATVSCSDCSGMWSSADMRIATVNSTANSISGIVTGVKPGSTTIGCTMPGGCYLQAEVTVFNDTGAISGAANTTLAKSPIALLIPCSGYDFFMNLVYYKDGSGTISLRNNIDITTPKQSKINSITDTIFSFSPFHESDFIAWLNNLYLKVGTDCKTNIAKSITEKIQQQNALDTANNIFLSLKKLMATKTDTSSKSDTASKQKTSLKLVNPEMVGFPNKKPIRVLSGYSKSNPIQKAEKIYEVKVKLYGPYDSNANQVIFYMDTGYLSDNAIIFPSDTLQTFQKRRWENALEGDSVYTFLVTIQSKTIQDTFNIPQSTYLRMKGVNGEAQLVQLANYEADKPFWVEVGANFDLASQQLQTTNLFGGVFLYKKDLARIRLGNWFNDKQRSNNLAICAGVYESKNFAQNNSTSFKMQAYTDSTSYPTTYPDSAKVYTDSGNVKMSIQIRNIGLFFSPQLRLTNRLAEENGLHLFLSLYGEMLWQDMQVNYNYSQVQRKDTTLVALGTIGNYSGKPASQEFDFYSYYEGGGFSIFFKEKDANLYFNNIFGTTNQPSLTYLDTVIAHGNNGTSETPHRGWHPFYLAQFRLSEEAYGISFSGEVRQLIGVKSDPYITLVLSKKFDLDKLINFNN